MWDGFEQPHRPARDCTTFGPFLFDREQYDSALPRLCAAITAAEEEPRPAEAAF